MTKYFLVKVDSHETTPGIIGALKESLDSDNQYRNTQRAFICDIRNVEVIARLDSADLQPSNCETISNGQLWKGSSQ